MRSLVIALGALALAGQANATVNLLNDGSFENGIGPGTSWTVGGTAGNSPVVVVTYGAAGGYPTNAYGEVVQADNAAGNPGFDAVGSKALYFSSDIGTQSVSQTASIGAGSYAFGFDFYLPLNGLNNPYGATFSAYLGTTLLGTFDASNYAAQTWYSFSGVGSAASSGTFDFSFTANGYPAKDFVIDRVYLTQNSNQAVVGVPEAGTWAMMVIGFGAIGAASRRRRTSLTFA